MRYTIQIIQWRRDNVVLLLLSLYDCNYDDVMAIGVHELIIIIMTNTTMNLRYCCWC